LGLKVAYQNGFINPLQLGVIRIESPEHRFQTGKLMLSGLWEKKCEKDFDNAIDLP
jgi:hypothetical protein